MTAELHLNGFTLDMERAELRSSDGHPVTIRAQAMAVLVELAKRHGELVTKQELFARVWPGVSVTDDSLVQCIVEIRRALGDTGQQIVRTLPRRGYTLVCNDRRGPQRPEAAPERSATPPTVARHRRVLVVIVACAAFAVAAVGWWAVRRGPSAESTLASVAALGANLAVLPLRAMPWLEANGGTTDAPPDGEGLAWLIAGELARNAEMRVSSPIATAALAREGLGAGAIGRRLGVSYVIDGGVARHGGATCRPASARRPAGRCA
jgi:DNA-binding winged helix-turn-helix (wHTH) protein